MKITKLQITDFTMGLSNFVDIIVHNVYGKTSCGQKVDRLHFIEDS